MITKFTAIHALVGGQLSGPINGPISEYKFRDGQTPPTEKQIQAKLSELHADYDSKTYVRSRLEEYPDLQECIHALLDGGDTLTELQSKRSEIKKKYPKLT